jgi:CubicO group peptidase (beta-lactamase class C family)
VTGLADFLRDEIAAGSFPGAVALLGSAEAILSVEWAGHSVLEPETRTVTSETLFDLASLTKPLCTGALVAADPKLGLALAPGRFLPEWKRTAFEGITLEHLLTHTSGLTAWYPLYAGGEGAAAYRRTVASLDPESPAGSRVIYSDLNFVVLGEVVEAFFAAPLAALFAEIVAAPAGSGARFLPEGGATSAAKATMAATEKGDRFERAMTQARGLTYAHFRDGVVWGEVHDGNAFRRGGVAGHAGLFGSARDVWLLARRWLEPPLSLWGVDRTADLAEARGLAWQGRRGAGSAVETMSKESFGHTGFTGTSVWLDPRRGLVCVLLTNRIHPVVREIPFNEVRQRFHAAAYAALE